MFDPLRPVSAVSLTAHASQHLWSQCGAPPGCQGPGPTSDMAAAALGLAAVPGPKRVLLLPSAPRMCFDSGTLARLDEEEGAPWAPCSPSKKEESQDPAPPKLFPHHGSEQAGSLQKLQAGPARRESSGCSIWTWGSTDSHLGSETNRLGGLTQYTKLQTWGVPHVAQRHFWGGQPTAERHHGLGLSHRRGPSVHDALLMQARPPLFS